MSEKKDSTSTNPIDAAEIVRTVMPEVRQQLVEKVVQSLAYDVYQAARKAVADDVKEWVEQEIAPALQAAMAERKDEIVASLAAEVAKVGPQIAEKMAEAAAKNLSSGYEFRAVLKSLFGGSY